jgi:quinol monooxygenase YgiN
MATKGVLANLEARLGMDAELEALLQSAVPIVEKETGTAAWLAVRYSRHEYGVFDAFDDDDGRRTHLAGEAAAGLQRRAEPMLTLEPDVELLDVIADKLTPAMTTATVSKGLLLTFPAKEEHEEEVEDFLRRAKAYVEDEPGTTAWFAFRTEAGGYGIIDVFPDAGARFAHLTGPVPRELAKHALTLLGGFPETTLFDVLAAQSGTGSPRTNDSGITPAQ